MGEDAVNAALDVNPIPSHLFFSKLPHGTTCYIQPLSATNLGPTVTSTPKKEEKASCDPSASTGPPPVPSAVR